MSEILIEGYGIEECWECEGHSGTQYSLSDSTFEMAVKKAKRIKPGVNEEIFILCITCEKCKRVGFEVSRRPKEKFAIHAIKGAFQSEDINPHESNQRTTS